MDLGKLRLNLYLSHEERQNSIPPDCSHICDAMFLSGLAVSHSLGPRVVVLPESGSAK